MPCWTEGFSAAERERERKATIYMLETVRGRVMERESVLERERECERGEGERERESATHEHLD